MSGDQELYLLRRDVLDRVDGALDDDHPYPGAYEALLGDADAATGGEAYSVTTKDERPPSGDPHDYLSQGPYWWPNDDTEDGLPYVRRDGVTNPAVEDLDYPRLRNMAEDVETLALAAYFSGETRYARQSAELLRVWFLEDATRMNPHVRYGQRVPGWVEGRGIGIIETRHLRRVIDAVPVLVGHGALSPAEADDLRAWFGRYVEWLLSSDHGREEAAHWNNHGSWYDMQVVAYLLFSGREELADTLVRTARLGERRIASHIVRGGEQPLELERTRPMHYSVHNLNALCDLARLAEHVDVDLWNFETYDRGLRPAIDWIADVIERDAVPVPDPDADELDWGSVHDLLVRAAFVYDEPAFDRVARSIPDVEPRRRRIRLLVPSIS